MAREIDNRVVEMEFKNKDFEKAIAVTMESLDELNEKLDKLNDINVKGFDELAKSANSVNFDKLSDSIDYIKDRFSLFGLAATKIKDKIIDEFAEMAMTIPKFINNAVDSVYDTAKEKGSARALNIAQAKFQLSNLGVEWSKIKGSIDQAVNDTRFGMDEAAMAASQLYASGVKLGDEMDRALLGISGVAAMTNAEYSDIAHIFTSIAGIGKVYRQQLNQIAGKGLNATAAIAKYMGITENEVNEILKDKDAFIDFETFAAAMWKEYGDAAKKGNDLFTGALSNAKAALGRIGEKFYTPFYEYARQVLVEVKPVINDINSALDPLFQNLDKVMSNAKDIIIDVLHRWDEGFDILGQNVNLKDTISKVMVWIGNLLDGLASTLQGKDGVLSLVGDTLLNVFYNLFSILKAIKDGFAIVFGGPTKKDVIAIVEKIHDFSESLRLSGEEIENIARIAAGIASVLDLVYKYGSAVYEVIIRPLVGGVLGFLIDELLDLLAQLGVFLNLLDRNAPSKIDLFVQLSNWAADFRFKLLELKADFESWVRIFEANTGIDFSKLFGDLKNAATHDVPEVIKLVGEGLVGAFLTLAGAIASAIQYVGELVGLLSKDSRLSEFVNTLKSQSTVLMWFQQKWDSLKDSFTKFKKGEITLSQFLGLDELKEKFEWLVPIIDKFKEHYKSIFEAESAGKIPEGGFIDTFGKKLKQAIMNLDMEDIWGSIGAGFLIYWRKKWLDIQTYVADSFNSFVGVFDRLTEGINASLVKMQKETNADKILKIAASVGILALSVMMLANIDPSGLQQALSALAMISVLLAAVIVLLGFITKETKKTKRDSEIFDDDVSLISNGKQKGTGQKANIFTKVFTTIGSRLTETKETIVETMHDLSGMPALILSFAASVALIIGSIRKLAMVGTTEGGMDAIREATMMTLGVMMLLWASVMTLLIVLGNYQKQAQKNDKEFDTTFLTKLAGLFIGIGLALKMISNSLLLFALVPEDRMAQVITASIIMGIMLMGMTAIVIILIDMVEQCKDANALLKAGAVFVMMAAAIQMLTLPLIAIGAATAFLGPAMLVSVGIITLLIAELFGVAVAFGMFFKDAPGAVAAMLAGSAAMLIMAMAITTLMIPLAAIMALAAIDLGSLMDAVTVITILTVVMSLMIVLFGVVGGATGGIGAVAMVAGAAAMFIMAKALQALIIPLAAMAALSYSGQLDGALKGLAEGLLLLAAAALGASLLAPGLMVLISVMDGIAAAILMLGLAALSAGKGMLDFVLAIGILQKLSLDGLAAKVEEAASGVIEGFHNALTGGQVKIKEGLVALVTMSCAVLVGSTGMIAEAVMVLITDVIVAIDNNAATLGFHLGHALWDIFAYAITGLLGGMIDMIEKAFGGQGGFSKFLMENLLPKKEAEKEGKGTLIDIFGGIFGSSEKEIGDQAETVGGNSIPKVIDGMDKGLQDPSVQNGFTGGVGQFLTNSFENVDLSPAENFGTTTGDAVVDANEKALDGKPEAIADNYVDTMASTATSKYNLSKLSNAGNQLASTFDGAVKDGVGMASPAKEAIKVGQFYNKGLVIGLEDNTEVVKAASDDASTIMNSMYGLMDSNAMKELSASIAGIGLFEDTDYQPTITPILDLSDVNQGFTSLNSMFASQRSLALAGEAAYLNDSGRALSMEIQNGNSKSMNQNFGALGNKLDRLGDAILSRQIVLDSGELVGGLANPMDRTLGVRAIRAQRGGRR